MKKILFAIVVLVASFSSFGSYRTIICDDRGTIDTTAVTISERINRCIQINSFKIWRKTILKTSIDQNATFTDQALSEFAKRGARGAATQYLINGFYASAAYIANRNNMTDAELDSAFLYLIWPMCQDIDAGRI